MRSAQPSHETLRSSSMASSLVILAGAPDSALLTNNEVFQQHNDTGKLRRAVRRFRCPSIIQGIHKRARQLAILTNRSQIDRLEANLRITRADHWTRILVS